MIGNVRYWHLADMGYCTARVRFWGQSGHAVLDRKCLLLTQSGHGVLCHTACFTPGGIHFPYRTSDFGQ